MPSTYTTNLGIEKPGDGEQDGIWGDIVNENMDILDRAGNGTLFLTLSGTASTLTTADGILSNGQYKLLALQGTPSGTHTITIAPNDAQKIYFVRNLTAQTVIFTQGSGGNYTLLAGDSAIINTSGAGATASVSSFTDHLAMSSPNITGGALSNVTIDTATITGGTISGAAITGVTDINVDGGTAAAPGYTFSTDLNTGMYSAGADSIGFSTGGTNRLLLSNTALQTTFLGTAAAPAYSFSTVTNTGMFSPGADLLGFSVAGSELLRLSTGGAQILGATTELKALEIGVGRTGNAAAIIDLIGDATYTDYGTRLLRAASGPNAATVLTHRGTGALQVVTEEAAPISFLTTNAERMRITPSGFVGIGTGAPAASLDVVGAVYARAGAPGALGVNNNGFSFRGDGDTGMFSVGDGYVDFYNNSAATMQISAAGNVGIGTGASLARVRIYRENPGAHNNSHIEMLSSAGDVVLGFHAVGATAVCIVHARGTGERLSFTNGLRTGYCPIDAAAFVVPSDYRIKENVTPLGGAIARLSALQPKRFNFLEGSMMYQGGATVDGFIAHEVSAVVPEAVNGEKDAVNEDGAAIHQGVDQAKLIPLLTAALQEAIAKINALEARIAALEA